MESRSRRSHVPNKRVSLSARKATPTRPHRYSSPAIPLSARSDTSQRDEFEDDGFGDEFPSKKLSFSCALLGGGQRHGSTTLKGQPLSVHLRIRPFTDSEKAATGPEAEIEPTIQPIGPDAVAVRAPESSKAKEKAGTFKFSKVHGQDTSQEALYSSVMKPLVSSALRSGQNGLLFAYGMTNAGKTYTVLGTEEDPGLLPRAVHDVLEAVVAANNAAKTTGSGVPPPVLRESSTSNTISDDWLHDSKSKDFVVSGAGAGAGADVDDGAVAETAEELATDRFDELPDINAVRIPPLAPGESLSVTVSCLEVYNEQVLDALDVPSDPEVARKCLKIKDGIGGRVYTQGLKQVEVKSVQDCLDVVALASQNRQVAETVLNADSSRSHCVFSLQIWKTVPLSSTVESRQARLLGIDATQNPKRLWSKISVVDLAGSERQRRTANRGARLKEAGAINNSLMTLMHCLETMRWNQRHPSAPKRMVPFRETKLTRLFQDTLAGAGSGVTVMVLNVGPAAADYDETLHALKYGAVAKDVRVVPPRVDTRWANVGRPSSSGLFRRHKMPLIPEGDHDENTLALGQPASKRRMVRQSGEGGRLAAAEIEWRAEKIELLSQISDLQAQNDSLRVDLKQANERCSIVEMEIRQEASEELATRLAEMEKRYQAMHSREAEAAEDRVKKLMNIYDRRTTGKIDKVRPRIAQVEASSEVEATKKDLFGASGAGGGGGAGVSIFMSPVLSTRKPKPSTPSTGSSSGSEGSSAADLAENVAECEDEIKRLRTRHETAVGALQKANEELQAQLAETKEAHLKKTAVTNSHFQEKLDTLTHQNISLSEEVGRLRMLLADFGCEGINEPGLDPSDPHTSSFEAPDSASPLTGQSGVVPGFAASTPGTGTPSVRRRLTQVTPADLRSPMPPPIPPSTACSGSVALRSGGEKPSPFVNPSSAMSQGRADDTSVPSGRKRIPSKSRKSSKTAESRRVPKKGTAPRSPPSPPPVPLASPSSVAPSDDEHDKENGRTAPGEGEGAPTSHHKSFGPVSGATQNCGDNPGENAGKQKRAQPADVKSKNSKPPKRKSGGRRKSRTSDDNAEQPQRGRKTRASARASKRAADVDATELSIATAAAPSPVVTRSKARRVA